MSAYAPRHAPPPRLTPVLLAALDAAVLLVAVLALVLAVLAITRTPAMPAALSAPVSAPAPVRTVPAPVTSHAPARTQPAAPLPYVVQRGDSLWSVAAWYYGDGSSWPRIWAANRAVIGSDPGMIRAGEILVIPDRSK